CLVGTAGTLLGARQIATDVRRLLRFPKNPHSDRNQFHEVQGRSFLRHRPIQSRQHVNLQLRRRAGLLDWSVPGVTVEQATYKMWAIDGGFKRNGFSVNGQYYFRWLGDFDADGPLPLASTFDHGFELSAGHFIVPKTLVLYARGSKVFGQFASPYE